MKKIYLYSMAILFVFFGGYCNAKSPNDSSKYQSLNSIVAVVNRDIITRGQLDDRVEAIKKQLIAQNQPIPTDGELRKKVLDQLISQQLQIQQAKVKNITISDEQLDQTIQNIAKQNNIPLLQLKQAVETQGLKFLVYRDRIRQELTLQAIQQQALQHKEIQVSHAEINDYLQKHKPDNTPKYHLQGILVALPKEASDAQITAAKEKCDNILTRLRAGADFTQTATLESDGTHRIDGGDLGWHTLSAADPFFAAQIIAARPQEIVGPLQTPEGLYIVKVLEIHADPLPPKEQLVNQVKVLLYQRKYMEAVEDWSKTLRAHAYVKVMA